MNLLLFRDFWRRHRRKFFITAGAFGSGYLFYKLYDAHKSHKHRLEVQERELTLQREREEHIKAQLSAILSLILSAPPLKKNKTKQNKTKEERKRKERNEILILYFCNADIDRIQAHFKNIQMISDTITLPHAMHYLSCRIAEDLDLSELLERLIQGKGQPNALTNSEKLELWGRLKIISMTLTWICHSAYLLLCYIVRLL